jgi:hypothetical protein
LLYQIRIINLNQFKILFFCNKKWCNIFSVCVCFFFFFKKIPQICSDPRSDLNFFLQIAFLGSWTPILRGFWSVRTVLFSRPVIEPHFWWYHIFYFGLKGLGVWGFQNFLFSDFFVCFVFVRQTNSNSFGIEAFPAPLITIRCSCLKGRL